MKQDVSAEAGMGTVAPPTALVTAVRAVMRPFVRVLLAQGLSFPWFKELLKELFVEVARRDFPIDGKQQTDSRISLITGVHRKDVRRLGAAPLRRAAETPQNVSAGAQIVALWIGHDAYLDDRRLPRSLPRLASGADGGASFESLVYAVSSDLRPRAVLDEWLRLGIARIDDDDRVHLNSDAFVPREGMDEKSHYFGANLRDHVAAAGHNLLGGRPPLFERSVHYDELSDESITELKNLAEKVGMEAILIINRRALELEKRDARKRSPRKRMNFGVYFFHAGSDEEI